MRSFLILGMLAGGCVRDPVAAVCPDLAPGDLAVTEIRASGTGDTLGSWVELYNASGQALDLKGVELRFRKPDGSSETDVTVRRSLPVGAGAYVVLGLFSDDDAVRPAYVDYGFVADFHVSWPSGSALDIDACGTKIDRVQYDSLPSSGTYSLGSTPPTADANDFATNWCTDATPAGTPQHANITCPVTP
jgi:hypothetical protein